VKLVVDLLDLSLWRSKDFLCSKLVSFFVSDKIEVMKFDLILKT